MIKQSQSRLDTNIEYCATRIKECSDMIRQKQILMKELRYEIKCWKKERQEIKAELVILKESKKGRNNYRAIEYI